MPYSPGILTKGKLGINREETICFGLSSKRLSTPVRPVPAIYTDSVWGRDRTVDNLTIYPFFKDTKDLKFSLLHNG